MSPELFENKPYNFKSDIWALGCCLYEMTTFKHPFDAREMSSLMLKVLRGQTLPIPQQYSTGLQELIRLLLSKQPMKRPSCSAILKLPLIKKHLKPPPTQQQQEKHTISKQNSASNLKYKARGAVRTPRDSPSYIRNNTPQSANRNSPHLQQQHNVQQQFSKENLNPFVSKPKLLHTSELKARQSPQTVTKQERNDSVRTLQFSTPEAVHAESSSTPITSNKDDDDDEEMLYIHRDSSSEDDDEEEDEEEDDDEIGSTILQGSLSQRIQTIRAYCISNLGEVTFNKVYNSMKDRDCTEEDTDTLSEAFSCPPDFISLITQLIFCEETLGVSHKK